MPRFSRAYCNKKEANPYLKVAVNIRTVEFTLVEHTNVEIDHFEKEIT